MTRDDRIGIGLVALLALFAILGPLVSPDPNLQPDLVNGTLLGPSGIHWLGTDQFSRDIFARLAYGARISLGVALVAVLVAATLGTLIGLAAGSSDGFWSQMWLRLINLGLALPRVVVLLVLLAAVGTLKLGIFAVVIGLTGWPSIARLVRGETLRLRNATYVTAAEALGAPRERILLHEILPGTLPPVLIAATLGVADAILLEAGLSFLGRGVPAPWPSWGGMILDAREYLSSAPMLLLAPAAALVAATTRATMLGDAGRRLLQPDAK